MRRSRGGWNGRRPLDGLLHAYLNLFIQFERAGRDTMTFHQW